MQWNAIASCATYMIPLQTDTQLIKHDSMLLSVVRSYHLELRSLTTLEDKNRLHQFGKKMPLGIFMSCALLDRELGGHSESLSHRHPRQRFQETRSGNHHSSRETHRPWYRWSPEVSRTCRSSTSPSRQPPKEGAEQATKSHQHLVLSNANQ